MASTLSVCSFCLTGPAHAADRPEAATSVKIVPLDSVRLLGGPFADAQRAPLRPKDQSAIENPIDAPSEEMVGSAAASGSPADRRIPRGSNYLFSGKAGVIWYLQFFFYQIGESKMGDYKFSSWTLHMASIIIFSSLWGLGLGEWKGANARAHRFLYLGLALLIASTLVVGLGNYLGSNRNFTVEEVSET